MYTYFSTLFGMTLAYIYAALPRIYLALPWPCQKQTAGVATAIAKARNRCEVSGSQIPRDKQIHVEFKLVSITTHQHVARGQC